MEKWKDRLLLPLLFVLEYDRLRDQSAIIDQILIVEVLKCKVLFQTDHQTVHIFVSAAAAQSKLFSTQNLSPASNPASRKDT